MFSIIFGFELIVTIVCLSIFFVLFKRLTTHPSNMTDITKCEKKLYSLHLSQDSKSFLDLPEDLIRGVCLKLPSKQLHHNIRNVSTEIRSVIEDLSLRPIGSFLMKSEKGFYVLYAYSKNKKISIEGSKIDMIAPEHWRKFGSPGYFKAAFKGKFVMNKEKLAFEYQKDKKDWKSIEEPPEQFSDHATIWITPHVLVCIGMQMAYMPMEGRNIVACKVQLLNFDVKKPKWYAPPVYRDNPLGLCISHPFLFNPTEGTIIMCGGYDDFTRNNAYKGILSQDKDIINWTELDVMPCKRLSAASFQLKNKLYIVGGMNGDNGLRSAVEWMADTLVFNLASETWSKGKRLPCTLEFPKAFVDSKGEYAFICGEMPKGGSKDELGDFRTKDFKSEEPESSNMVMFTFNEEQGFKEVEDIDMEQFPFDCDDWEVVHTIE